MYVWKRVYVPLIEVTKQRRLREPGESYTPSSVNNGGEESRSRCVWVHCCHDRLLHAWVSVLVHVMLACPWECFLLGRGNFCWNPPSHCFCLNESRLSVTIKSHYLHGTTADNPAGHRMWNGEQGGLPLCLLIRLSCAPPYYKPLSHMPRNNTSDSTKPQRLDHRGGYHQFSVALQQCDNNKEAETLLVKFFSSTV